MSDPLLERIPPQSLEAEQATLGAMLTEREAIARVVDVLDPDDFYSPQHQALYRAMVDLFNDSAPVDLVTLQARLQDRGQLDQVGGTPYLLSLQEASPTAAAISHYARIVRERSVRRGLIRAAGEIRSMAQTAGDEDVQTILDRCQEELRTVRHGASAQTLQIVELRDFLADTTPPPPDVIEGVAKAGTVISIFGAPGSAKSFLGADLCLAATVGSEWLGQPCCRGPAALCEQERAPHLVRKRLQDLVQGIPRPDDASPLYVIPFQNLRLDTAEEQARFRAQVLGLHPKLIVIDTAISVAGSVDFVNPTQVRAWMRFWRELAIELDGTVCLICHCPKWASKEPQLASLFGSEDFGAALDFAFASVQLDKSTFRLCAVKNTWGDELPDLTFSIGPGEDGGLILTHTAGAGGVRHILMKALPTESWAKGGDLCRLVEGKGYSSRAGREMLKQLVEDGGAESKPDPTHKGWYLYRGLAQSTESEAP